MPSSVDTSPLVKWAPSADWADSKSLGMRLTCTPRLLLAKPGKHAQYVSLFLVLVVNSAQFEMSDS